MSAAELIGCAAGDTLVNGQFFRVVFEPFAPAWLVASSDFANDMKALRESLGRVQVKGAEFLTPVSSPAVLPGEVVAVIDFKVLLPAGVRATVADAVSALEHAKLSLSVQSLAKVTASQLTEKARSDAATTAAKKQEDESLLEYLVKLTKRVGLALLLVALAAIAFLAFKWTKALAPA